MLKGKWVFSVKQLFFMCTVFLMSAALIISVVAPDARAAKAEAQKAVAALVDLNSATEKELEAIKGIGPATAKKIIAGRPYKSVDELSKAGLNAKAIEGIKPYVAVGKAQAAPTKPAVPAAAAKAETTKSVKEAKTAAKPAAAAAKLAPGTKININTADQATLEKLPEIGPVKAKAIIAGRPYKTVEDVMKISGVKGKTFDTIKEYIVVK
jgi:competence protein ComEA